MQAPTTELSLHRFRIERTVGRGAAGIIFKAFDTQTKQDVALKVIATSGADTAERGRFLREGQILSDLDHPGIVRVVAFGATGEAAEVLEYKFEVDSALIAMQWLDGEDLQVRHARAPLSLKQAIDVAAQIANALSAAHARGVIHRDIKPSNIFVLAADSREPATPGAAVEASSPERLATKLVDFGVASTDDVRLTKTDELVGTPAYMSPEQARGDTRADARSDIYSLGATLFELIAGRPPHVGPTSIATLARLVTSPAPRLSDLVDGIPRELDELVDRMLRANRDERPDAAREVHETLDSIRRRIPDDAHATARTTESHHGVGTRLVTTLVGLHVGYGDTRRDELERLQKLGADAMPLGSDAVVAHLGAQRAHGNEASRAIEAGLALCARGARVGIATGRTEVDLLRPAGEIVDRASAIARDADDRRLVVDATTAELARNQFDFTSLPNGTLAVERPAHAAQHEQNLASHFVGRDAELVASLSAYDRCTEDATPVILTVSGPPGIGKSRLLREFVARIKERGRSPKLAHVRGDPYALTTALGLATQILRGLLDLPQGLSFEDALAALADGGLTREVANPLARLMANQPFPEGADSRGARDALYISMTEIVLNMAASAPVVVLFEDAQWSDFESIAWLDHVLGRSSGRPLFVFAMMRPAFWREHPRCFAGRDHVRVELRPIARRATREIARSVIGAAATEEMLDQVAQQAAGSPLFAEELARLIAAGKDATKAPTIEAAIQVSLDALDDQARAAAVQASVFGLTVWDAGVAAVGGPSSELALAKLVAAELLVVQPSSRFANTREYAFKHVLLRDVAFASAGEEQRRALHAAAGRWLASVGEDTATVAHHFDLGGLVKEAADYWEIAARRALATDSLKDSVAMADRALTFASDGPVAFARAALLDEAHSRLDARASERQSAIATMSDNVFDEASELRTMGARARYDHARAQGLDVDARLLEVRQRARDLDLVEEEARCSATLAQRYAFAGQLVMAEREAEHLLGLADQRGIGTAAVDAWQTLAVVRQTRGQLASALDARRRAAEAARAAGLRERDAILTANLGFALTTIGARDEALRELELGLAKARAIGSAGAVRHGHMNLLGWTATFGAVPHLDAELAETRASADEAATGMWVVRDRVTLGILFYRGCELLRGGASGLSRARTLLAIAADAYRATANHDVLPVALAYWAEAERRNNLPDKALEIAREAAELVERGAPSLLNEAPIYLVLHDTCVDIGDLEGARRAMKRSMAPLVRRLTGLEGTPYARSFLLGLSHNSALIAAAEAYRCVPPEIERFIEHAR
jgi:serine/threonine protein kinase/tetratricopeptide (TPR) repeat protein